MSSELPVLNQKRKPDEFCLPCGLYKKCESPIMNGEGSEDPLWLFVGEGPGGDEDLEGIPFIGRAGDLLRTEIESLGFNTQKCRFSNAVRCRPPDNDISAVPDAVGYCRPHILREIRATRPKVVVLLGNTAIGSLLNKKKITRLNGEVFAAHGRFYVACVHPAYVLRNEDAIGEFRRALKIALRLGKSAVKREKEKPEHVVIRDKKMLYEVTDLLKKEKDVATDIEGATLSTFSKTVKPQVGVVGFSPDPKRAFLYPVYARIGMESKIKVRPEEVMEAVQELWEHPDIDFSLHFGKYDISYMWLLHKIWLRRYIYDTGLMSYTVNENKGIHGLKDWAWRLGMGGYEFELREYQRNHPEANPSKGGTICMVPAHILYPYNMNDCRCTTKARIKLLPELQEKNLWEKPYKFPIMWHNWLAMQMEMFGLNLDLEYNSELMEEFPATIVEIEKKISQSWEYKKLTRIRRRQLMEKLWRRVCNYKREVPDKKAKVLELFENELEKKKKKKKDFVNLASPDDKRDLIYRVAKYEPVSFTKKAQLPSVKATVLEELRVANPTPLLTQIIERSEYGSSFSKYIKPLENWAGSDGRTHTSYLVHGIVTGRVSSQDPNHESLPKRGKKQLVIPLRRQFVSSGENYTIIEADEKQVEMRLFADRAKDKVMIQEFNDGKDPHRMGASAAFEIPEEEVTKDQRTACKSAVSFGLLYGRRAKALAGSFGKSERWAQRFIDRYFGKYAACKRYIKNQEKFFLKEGMSVSHFGRLRRLQDQVKADDFWERAEAVRELINAPIQGDASDITWCAGHRLQRWLYKYRMRSKVIVAVHDDLKVDTYHKELWDVIEKLFEYMTDREWIEKMTDWYCQVPLDVDISIGPNLGDRLELVHKPNTLEFTIPKGEIPSWAVSFK